MDNNLISGGKGCFRAGTLIQQENGKTTPIELIKVGDEILAFDELGDIHLAKVTEVHYHEDPEPLMRVKFWNGEICITPNHWVLNQYEAFAEVGRMTTHDAFVDGMGHLRPIIDAKAIDKEPVWNLTVEPHHTFIANGIRVHNGGFRERFPVAGGKGGSKGGGSSRAPIEDPDSLRSRQYARVIDLISEGEIVGLVDGMKSVYLDDTPVMDSSGNYNFNGVSFDIRTGTQSQSYIPGFSAVEAETAVSTEIVKAQPVVRSISNPNANAVRVTISIPRLTYQDLENGDMHGTTVQVGIDVNTNGGGWVPARLTTANLSFPISGTTSHTNGNYTLNATIGVAWEGITPPAYDQTYWWINSTNYQEVQYCYFNVDYRLQPGGAWTTFYSGVLSGAPTAYYSAGWWDGLNEGTTYYHAPTGTGTYAVDLPEGPYEFRVVKTSGSGIVSINSSSGYSYTSVDTITGKTTSTYQRSYRIPLSGTGPWDIRVSRITDDSTASNLQNETFWASYTELVDSKLRYPNSALMALSVDAEQFSSIPKRGYEIYGLKIRVPSNYNPITRVYTGTWDGTFQTTWSDNPAWCFYDIITNTRYGLGSFIDPSQIDKWSLYSIGQYCDQAVPNGFGGYEPRFTCNLYLQTREEAYNVVNYMASIFRGMTYWAAGAIVPVQDSPQSPVALFNASNVIDGMFTYEGSSAKARHTVALVSWNDPADRYKQKIEYVEDEDAIKRYGIIQSEILAVGCTSRGQAHRLGKWLIYSERYETETITFKTGIDGLVLNPGDIIKVTDPTRSGERMGGRVVIATTTQVTIDNPIEIESGKTYILWSMLPDGSVVSRGITNGIGITSILTVDVAFAERPLSQSVWVLQVSTLVPETWRVIGLKEADQNTAEVTALYHREDKFAYVENNVHLIDLPTNGVGLIPEAPESGNVSDAIYFNGPNILTKLLISWKQTKTAYKYVVQYRRTDENWTELAPTVGTSVDVHNVTDGSIYAVRIYSINALGTKSSSYLEFSHTVLGKMVPPSDVPSIYASPFPTGVELVWDDIIDIDRFDFGFTDGSTWTAPITWVSGTSYILPPQTAGTHTFRIKARDTSENVSTHDTYTTCVIYAPQYPTVTTTVTDGVINVKWNDCTTTHQISHYEVRLGGTSWSNATVITSTNSLSVKISPTWQGDSTVRVKAVDIAGNISSEGAQIIAIAPPAAPTVSTTIIDSDVQISWTLPTSTLPVVSYEIRYGASWATGTTIGKTSASNIKYKVNWVGARNWWVAAIDSAGNVGTAGSATSTISSPSTPIVTNTYEVSSARLSWTSSKTTLPIDYYEVRRGAEVNTSILLGTAYTTSFSIPVDWPESATFWVKAVDSAGNSSGYGTFITTITPPNTPSITYQFIGEDCVLSWAEAASSSLPVAGYEVRTGSTWETSTLVGITSDFLLRTPSNWVGNKTFFLKAFDSAGAYGTATTVVVYVGVYAAPSSLTLTHSLTDLVLQWGAATGGQTPIDYYEIRYGGVWSTAAIVGRSNSSTITVPITWTGSRTFWVHAVDVYGSVGSARSATYSVSVPGTIVASSTVVGVKAQLSWTEPVSGLPVSEYEIRYGASWATSTFVTTQAGTDYRVSIDWLGSRTFWINAIDVNGNYGTAGSTSVTITVPQTPSVTATVNLDLYVLKWTTPSAVLPVTNYEIRYGASWAAGTTLGLTNSNTISVKGSWLGSRIFWVAAIDINGNYGTAGSVTATINPPAAPPQYRQEVVDNNVLLYWGQVQGTMPTLTYDIRKGSDWASAIPIGQKAGGFTTIFETAAGTFTYWIAAIDTAGNTGTPTSLACVVNSPPDYVLKLNLESVFNGTKTNIVVENGALVLPVNTAENFQSHFTTRTWTTPQNQIDAQYPVYIQPAQPTATYTETYDYGTILAANKITVTVNASTITGSVTITPTISASTDGSTWVDYPGVYQTYATNFRYIKYTIVCTGADDKALLKISSINLRLDSKLKTTTSVVNCIADSSGTYIQNGTTTITVTAAGNWVAGQYVDLDFTTGTSADGIYRIVTGGSGTFTVTASVAISTSGSVTVDASGTVLYLTETRLHTGQKNFIDVDAIQVSASGITPLIAIYNFVDIANPLYLKVLLFNTSGVRVAGSASVTVRGF